MTEEKISELEEEVRKLRRELAGLRHEILDLEQTVARAGKLKQQINFIAQRLADQNGEALVQWLWD